MNDLIYRAEEKVIQVYLIAEKIFHRNFTLPKVIFRDMGRTAGRAHYHENKITLSPTLLKENTEIFLNTTIPHEIAHLITFQVFGVTGHGPVWKRVMMSLGVKEIKRCHSYDTSSVGQKRQKFVYVCSCNKFLFGVARHRKVQNDSAQYHCVKNKHRLTFSGEII